MTDGSPSPIDREPGLTPVAAAPVKLTPTSPTQLTSVPKSNLIALVLLAVAVFSCLIHWLVRHSSAMTVQVVLYWCAVITAISACLIAFRNRSHRLSLPLIAFGLLLLAISLSMRTSEEERSNPGLMLNVTTTSVTGPDATLSVGIPEATVELAGLSADWNGTLTSDWWRASGVMVKRREWSIATDYMPQFKEGYSRRLVLHIHGRRAPAKLLAFDFDGSPGAYNAHAIITADASPDEWLVLSKIFGGNQKSTVLRMVIASGDFQGPNRTSMIGDSAARVEGTFGDVTFSTEVVAREGRDAIQLHCHCATAGQIYEFRVRLIDHDGVSQIVDRLDQRDFSLDRESSPDRTFLFAIPTGSKIAQIIVERRPGYWVEFREISLLAGHHTSPQAFLGRPPTLTP